MAGRGGETRGTEYRSEEKHCPLMDGVPRGERGHGWSRATAWAGWEDSRLYKAFCLSGWFVPQPLTHHTTCGFWFSDQESSLCPLHGEPRVEPQNSQGCPTSGLR